MFGQTHHFVRYATDQKYSLDRYATETHRLYRVLDTRLGQTEFVAGEQYSIADIAIFPWVSRFALHQLDWADVPNVKRWYDRLSARPAVKRGMEVLA